MTSLPNPKIVSKVFYLPFESNMAVEAEVELRLEIAVVQVEVEEKVGVGQIEAPLELSILRGGALS